MYGMELGGLLIGQCAYSNIVSGKGISGRTPMPTPPGTTFHLACSGLGWGLLTHILGQTLIRHTKKQVLGGIEVLQLPPKMEELVAGAFVFEKRMQMFLWECVVAALHASTCVDVCPC
jgi:hypothetical protein